MFHLPLRAMHLASDFRRPLARNASDARRIVRVQCHREDRSWKWHLRVNCAARRCRRESIVASLGLSRDGQERIDRIG